MFRALWTAASGMTAQQANIDNISNNLANVNTTGYKKSSVEFQDLLYANLRGPNAQNAQGKGLPVPIQLGTGVKIAGTKLDFAKGNLQQTGNPFDLAITGDAFFELTLANGKLAYTKDGSFKVNSDGNLVTSDGNKVNTTSGTATFTKMEGVSVASNGAITATDANGTVQQLGTLKMVTFVNPLGLDRRGQNLYLPSAASGQAKAVDANTDNVMSGYIETSNVQVAEEMVKMIIAQRAYEINSKAITTSDEMMGIADNLKR